MFTFKLNVYSIYCKDLKLEGMKMVGVQFKTTIMVDDAKGQKLLGEKFNPTINNISERKAIASIRENFAQIPKMNITNDKR